MAWSPWGTLVPNPKVPIPSIPPTGLQPLQHRDPPQRYTGICSPDPICLPRGVWYQTPALGIIPQLWGCIPLHPPVLCSFTTSISKHWLPPQPPADVGDMPRCPPAAWGWGTQPRSPAEHRLLLSKPNFLAGLRESQGAPPSLPSKGERSEPVFLNWFNLFSGADVKHFVTGDNSTFSEVENQTQRLQVADNELN